MNYQRKISRYLLPELAIAITLAFLLLVSPAYAEGELPPADNEPAATETHPADPLPAEDPFLSEPDSSEPVLTEPATTVPDVTPEDLMLPAEPVLEPAAEVQPAADPEVEVLTEEPAVADVAAALEENELSLVNEAGEALPMASQETADVFSTADPYFKVGAVTYRFLAGFGTCAAFPLDVCTDNLAAPISSAISYIQTNGTVPSDGKIYVEAGSYTESVTIDGTNPNLSNLKGLIGVDGLAVTTINGNVSISNTLTGFTLNGFTINGRLIIETNTGTMNLENLDVNYTASVDYPIYVDNHKGSINVKQVKSSGNRFSNYFNNTLGTGNITITQSAFDDNEPSSSGSYANGLHLYSNGTITLDGVSASDNNGSGALILDAGALTIKNSVFNNNYAIPDYFYAGYGVYAEADKAITVSQVIANNNEQEGLFLITPLTATLTDVTTNNNGNNGVLVNAANGTGAVKVSYSTFKDNDDNGLLIYAKGSVTLTSVIASLNNSYGVFVDNCQLIGLACTGTGTVTVTSLPAKGEGFANAFLDNTLLGLNIYSKANILVENFTASGNLGNNAVLLDNSDGTGGVTIKATLPGWMNSIDGNTNGNGLYIISDGAISVDKVHSSINDQNGIWLSNESAPTIKPITLSNTVSNGNGQFGILLYSRGLVTLTNVDSYDHINPSYDGVIIDTTYGSGGVNIKATTGQTNDFYNNDQDGLQIITYGSVTISDVTSSFNGLHGLWISSNAAAGTQTVSLTRVTVDDSTFSTGIYITATGPISLTNVTSSNNANGAGADINNSGSLKTPGVTVKNSVFNNNLYDGLSINSKGTVSITTITANDNHYNGLYVDNCGWTGLACAGVGGITIASSSGSENIFSGNTYNGVSLYSGKNILLTNIQADNNGDAGIWVVNNYTGSTGNITITATTGKFNSASSNGQDGSGDGVFLNSFGTVTVSRLNADSNNGMGLKISNDLAVTAKAVSVSDSTFTNNLSHGLYIFSMGLITLKGIESSDNTGYGAYLDNSNGSAGISILPGASGKGNTFNQNTNYGVYVNTNGAVTFNKVQSEGNGYSGGYLLNNNAANSPITFTTVNFDNNGDHGVWIYTAGNVIWKGGGASGNVNIGAYIDGNYGLKMNTVTLSNVSFNDNQTTYGGLYIYTKGNITLTSVNAIGNLANFGYGGHLDNCLWDGFTCGGNGNVVITSPTSSSFSNNMYYGLYISTRGTVQLTNVSASDNGSTGIEINANNGTGSVSVQNTNLSANNTISDNGYYGLYILAKGAITINQVKALDNANTNMTLISYTAPIIAPIKISNVVANGSTSGHGIFAQSAGAITLNKVVANDNGQSGAYLESGAGMNILVTSSQFNDNVFSGLYTDADGKITLNAVTANGNGETGAYLDNDTGTGDVEVLSTLGDNHFSLNGTHGLNIATLGNVKLSKITSQENALRGVTLNNTGGSGTVTVTTLVTRMNGSFGVFITSDGAVALSGITSMNNGVGTNADGLYVSSTSATGVKLSNSVFLGNGGSGIEADVLTTNLLTLVNTAYLGNDANDNGFLDLDVY